MIKRPHYIAFILIVLLVLGLFRLPAQTAARIKLAIGSVFVPLFGVKNSSHQALQAAGNAVTPRSELVRQNELLRRDNEQLRLYAQQTQEVWRENNHFRQLLQWQRQAPWKVRLARVIGRDPDNWWRTLHIDLGEADGIRLNQPVLTGDGALLGRISSVGKTRSQVLLLGDPNLRVGALIQSSPASRDTGVIMAGTAGPLEHNMIDLNYLSPASQPKPGQWVITSGEGGIFPKGVLIGQIIDWRLVGNGIAKEARVKLSANLGAVEEVWVMSP